MKRIVWILVCASSAFAQRAHQCSDMTRHKIPGVTKRAIPSHGFGLGLRAKDEATLLVFLRVGS